MPNKVQEQSFGAALLDQVVAWAGDNLPIDGIYTDGEIKSFCASAYNANDVYDLDELIAYIRRNYTVDEIFSWDELHNWADENGFILKE